MNFDEITVAQKWPESVAGWLAIVKSTNRKCGLCWILAHPEAKRLLLRSLETLAADIEWKICLSRRFLWQVATGSDQMPEWKGHHQIWIIFRCPKFWQIRVSLKFLWDRNRDREGEVCHRRGREGGREHGIWLWDPRQSPWKTDANVYFRQAYFGCMLS